MRAFWFVMAGVSLLGVHLQAGENTVPAAAASKSTEDEEWKAAILKKMERKVTFELAETPLGEAIDFLNSLGKLGITVSPEVDTKTEISAKLTDVELCQALTIITKLANAKWELSKDRKVHILPAKETPKKDEAKKP